MSDNLIKIGTISIAAVLLVVVGKYIAHILQVSRDQTNTFRNDYDTFKQAFSHAIQQLETRDTTLNVLIFGEFPKHDMAMKNFIHHMRWLRKRRFLQKWSEYNNKYNEVKNLGVLGFAAAIAPSIEELNNNPSPDDMDKWEIERSKQLLDIIHSLLSIGSKKYWF